MDVDKETQKRPEAETQEPPVTTPTTPEERERLAAADDEEHEEMESSSRHATAGSPLQSGDRPSSDE